METIEAPERWADVPCYEGVYQASDAGRIRSIERYVTGGKGKRQFVPEKILKQTLDSYGYRVVSICNSNAGIKKKVMKVHRLVLLAFVGESELVGCHDDGDQTNNRLRNLKYGTPLDNADDRTRHGKQVGALDEENGVSKLNDIAVLEIRGELECGISCPTLARKHHVCVETIRKIKLRKTWRHI